MKDKYSWLAVFIIFCGLFLVFAGVNSMETESISDFEGVILSFVGLTFAFVGGILLRINEIGMWL